MNAKDLRTEAALGDRSNDGNTKYAQGGGALPCHRNKTYQDIGSNTLAKVDAPPSRPCAVIGPDRVVPPPAPAPAAADYHKKSPLEPWLTPDGAYRRPPEYPHKLLDYQHPSRNISPRQTFQENMQRIMVPPSYNAGKLKEDHNFTGDPNITQMRNIKLNVPTDSNTKYCDVPYTVNPIQNEQKSVRNSDVSVSNMNSVLARGPPHGWPPTSSNIQPPKQFHQELCQYPEYQNCAPPRPMLMTRPHRAVHEEPGPVYPEAYYQQGNIRFKPYPSVKERYQQARYEYIGNYSNPFHPPPPFPSHKYDPQKPLPPHPYPNYPQVPLKYLDTRMGEPIMNGYQRTLNQQPLYNNMPYRNPVIHPNYGPVPGNGLPSGKYYSYPPDTNKPLAPNKLPYDPTGKLYPDYESSRSKNYPTSDAFYVNDISRSLPPKGPVLPPNYPTNIHGIPAHGSHPYYRKEPIKGYEYSPHFRNMDHMLGFNGNLVARFPSQFSPSGIAISPADSNTSNDTNQTQGTCQEDCGYVSQSSTASVRSMDSVINRMPPDPYRRYDYRYNNIMKGSAAITKHEQSSSSNVGSTEKKDIDVRQFLQMWNEGEDEGGENSSKEVNIKIAPNSGNSISAANYETVNQEQLYVLGLVNVPSEELSKYEHIQKVSKLPENIKGYNSIELLHQFEEVVESSNLNHYNSKTVKPKPFHDQLKSVQMHGIGIPSRPISPLDVEAKISQSVIHKEVGCNFEIKPCSPKMLNVEVATPVQTITGERVIEKVSNPLIDQPQILQNANESRDDCNIVQKQLTVHDNTKNTSCKMGHKPYGNKDPIVPLKTNYSIQDLESNSGVCLASLPRLDNDIELNFPEVNQQFINANKVESVITSAPVKDLTSIEGDQTHTTDCETETDNINSSATLIPEKDFTKLSKYRKLKRKSPGPNIPEVNVQAMRTDSVIIKNPENCKHDNFERTLSPKATPKKVQENPINLSVNTESRNTASINSYKTGDFGCNNIAIDFSLNSHGVSNVANINTKVAEINSTINHQDTCNELKVNAVIRTTENIQNEQEIKKSNENVCILNSSNTASNKESLDVNVIKRDNTSIADNDLGECKLASQADIGYSNSTDKLNRETPDKKLTSYNDLSSEEKEDTINEKMRELFGEDFSTVEAEPYFEQIHDTQAILDDNSVDGLGKEYVFSDESSQAHDRHETSMSEDLENEIQSSSVCSKGSRAKNKQKWDLVSKDALLSQSIYEKNDFENSDGDTNNVSVVLRNDENLDQQLIFSDINSCLSQLKSEEPLQIKPKTYRCRVSKELLSPWIQKLIINCEGSCSVNNKDLFLVENKKKNVHSDSRFLEPEKVNYNCENIDEFDSAGILKTNKLKSKNNAVYNQCGLETIETCKVVEDNKRDISSIVFKKDDSIKNEDSNNLVERIEKLPTDTKMKNIFTGCDTLKNNHLENLEIINKHRVSNRPNNETGTDDYENNCRTEKNRVLETSYNHETVNSPVKDESNDNVTETSICDKHCEIESTDEDEMTLSQEIEKPNGKVMESDVCKSTCKIESYMGLQQVNEDEITNSQANEEPINECTEANVCNSSSETELPEALEKVDEELINNIINRDSHSEEMDTDACDNSSKIETCKNLNVVDEPHPTTNEIAIVQDNNKSNNQVIVAVNNDNSSENKTGMVVKTFDKQETAESLKSNTSTIENTEADKCEDSFKKDLSTLDPLDKIDCLNENNKCDKATESDFKILNEKQITANEDIDDTNNLKNTTVSQFEISMKNENTLQSGMLSSRNQKCEEVAGDFEHVLDNVSNNDTVLYHQKNSKIPSSAITAIFKSTEYINNSALKTDSETEDTKCCDRAKNTLDSRDGKEKAVTDDYEMIFDIDNQNLRIKALAAESEILSDKYLNRLNCQSCSSWSLSQSPEHMGILSPLSSDTDSDEDENLSENKYDASLVSDVNNIDKVKPISRKLSFDRSKNDNELSDCDPKMCKQFEATSPKKISTERIPILNKTSKSVHNLEGTNTNAQEEIEDPDKKDSTLYTETPKSTRNAVACSVNSKLNNGNALCEIDSINVAPLQNNSKTVCVENNAEDTVTEGCCNDKVEPLIDESTSCSDVSEETSTSDGDDNNSECSDVLVSQNEESYTPFSVGAVNNKAETYENNMMAPVTPNNVHPDKVTQSNKLQNDTDSLGQKDTHDQDITSEIPNVDVECSSYGNKDYEQTYGMKNITSGPIFNNCNEEEYKSHAEDCDNQRDNNVQRELVGYTLDDSQDLATNCVHVSENIMNDSGVVIDKSPENTSIELLEDISPDDIQHENSKSVRYATNYLNKRRKSLKRSLSDSALDDIKDSFKEESSENDALVCPNKRRKDDEELNNYNASRFIAENICQVLQSNRRNSISSIHNEGNVSFCILIDNNCIISEECDESAKICFSEVPEDCLANIQEESLTQEHQTEEINLPENDNDCEYFIPADANLFQKDKLMEEPWVDDVACVETVVSEDIGENVVICAAMSPKDDDEETQDYDLNEHTDKLKCIYGDKIYNDDTHFVQTLYRTPQMNVNKTLSQRDFNITDDSQIDYDSRYYDKESLERVLSEPNVQEANDTQFVPFPITAPLTSPAFEIHADGNENFEPSESPKFHNTEHLIDNVCPEEKLKHCLLKETKESMTNSCESSLDDVFDFGKCEESSKCATSSSPEVSSTTSEEKNSGILLKITNYGGSRVSQVNNISPLNRISCKYTEKKDYSSSSGNLPTRTLLTKGAQKYIPPLKETIRNLKVKLPLPEQSLLKLKQLKLAKEELKLTRDRPSNNLKREIPKKIKPKFEDVLKSIDEMQFQKHRESNKKARKSIPKVVIKKNEHGSHYASTSNKNKFNPDLTGMKWQPWVFLEKNDFIDKMALRNKTRAIFSYRKNTYVLAEKFKKYKSACNTKFVISQPKHKDSTPGQLKYTIRLKHNY